MISVAVVGCGYWGPNLIRNFAACDDTRLVAICDQSPARLAKMLARYPGVQGYDDFDLLLDHPSLDAVAIATPAHTHAALGLAALAAGKHVLVEKPLADTSEKAARMVHLARARGLVLMVDHTFVYSPAVRLVKRLVDSGDIGDLYYVDSVRVNLGNFQRDVNVVWDLAPHDLSILDHLLGRLPLHVSAMGACHVDRRKGIEDTAHLNLDFGNGLLAALHVSWLSPIKVRRFMIGGSKKSIVFDDLEPSEKIKVYDRGVVVADDPESQHNILIDYRTGDVWSPHVEQTEPLQNMVRHFAECIRDGRRPLTDGECGLRVVKIIETSQRCMRVQGLPLAA